MVRIQLHLSAKQDRALKAMARARGTTRAELIRLAIDGLLAERATGGDALTELIGSAGRGGKRDLSAHHDELLYRHEPVPLSSAADGE